MNEPQQLAAAKPFAIPKRVAFEAWEKVKFNRGAAGVDDQSIAEFEADLKGNLYRTWNRISSGSYSRLRFERWKYRNQTVPGSVFLVFQRSPHRAKSSQANGDSNCLTVTHPFHPLAGQYPEVLFERRLPTGLAYSCAGGPLAR